MWQPNKSTILSVLVSIQAMILGAPFPYYNEPGYGFINPSEAGGPVVEYNRTIQCKTVWYAMVFWLEEKHKEEPVWRDVSDTYWKHNGHKVAKQVREWMKDNEALLSYEPNMPPYHAYGHTHAHGLKMRKGKGKAKSTEHNLVQLLEALVTGESEEGQEVSEALDDHEVSL